MLKLCSENTGRAGSRAVCYRQYPSATPERVGYCGWVLLLLPVEPQGTWLLAEKSATRWPRPAFKTEAQGHN